MWSENTAYCLVVSLVLILPFVYKLLSSFTFSLDMVVKAVQCRSGRQLLRAVYCTLLFHRLRTGSLSIDRAAHFTWCSAATVRFRQVSDADG
jgi:hypothetical protein